MSKINDGGRAFPRPVSEDRKSGDQPDGNSTVDEQDGMSLRDYFAGQALAGIVCGTQAERMKPTGPGEAAHWAYQIADAMIAARDQTEAAS